MSVAIVMGSDSDDVRSCVKAPRRLTPRFGESAGRCTSSRHTAVPIGRSISRAGPPGGVDIIIAGAGRRRRTCRVCLPAVTHLPVIGVPVAR